MTPVICVLFSSMLLPLQEIGLDTLEMATLDPDWLQCHDSLSSVQRIRGLHQHLDCHMVLQPRGRGSQKAYRTSETYPLDTELGKEADPRSMKPLRC